jgi:hypothetical protein
MQLRALEQQLAQHSAAISAELMAKADRGAVEALACAVAGLTGGAAPHAAAGARGASPPGSPRCAPPGPPTSVLEWPAGGSRVTGRQQPAAEARPGPPDPPDIPPPPPSSSRSFSDLGLSELALKAGRTSGQVASLQGQLAGLQQDLKEMQVRNDVCLLSAARCACLYALYASSRYTSSLLRRVAGMPLRQAPAATSSRLRCALSLPPAPPHPTHTPRAAAGYPGQVAAPARHHRRGQLGLGEALQAGGGGQPQGGNRCCSAPGGPDGQAGRGGCKGGRGCSGV